jgi:hypothetical protein
VKASLKAFGSGESLPEMAQASQAAAAPGASVVTSLNLDQQSDWLTVPAATADGRA